MRDRSDARAATSSRARPAIEVDLPSLRRIAADLRDLSREFADRNGTLQMLLDDPDLGGALRHAERDWHDQRRRINAFLTGVSDALAGSLDAYEHVERELATAVKPALRHN
jgi:hypothetical protein